MEACLKFARRYWHTRGETARTKYVAFTHSFHGRTMGALSVTWDEHYRAPFEPLIPGVSFASTPTSPRRSTARRRRRPPPSSSSRFRARVACGRFPRRSRRRSRARARRTGALLIADEVQTGSGRTGAFLRSRALGLTPDLVALGKALGAGMPVGAAMVSAKVAATISAGDHGTTYGGNLLACRAALTFLDVLEGGLLASIAGSRRYLFAALRELAVAASGARSTRFAAPA